MTKAHTLCKCGHFYGCHIGTTRCDAKDCPCTFFVPTIPSASEINSCYEQRVTVYELGDIPDLLESQGWPKQNVSFAVTHVAIVDAEMDVIAIVPRNRCETLVRVLNAVEG